MPLENNQATRISCQNKEKTAELTLQKCNKMPNTWDRANIMTIIPTLQSANQPRCHQTAL